MEQKQRMSKLVGTVIKGGLGVAMLGEILL